MGELSAALGSTQACLPRARQVARRLARRPAFLLDVQRVFAWLPPDRPAGEALFRLVEAFPRTPDRAAQCALVHELVSFLRHPVLACAARPLVDAATALLGGQFVYAADIDRALRRAARSPRAFSFDMLGEGARTEPDAQRGLARYREAIQAVAKHSRGGRFGVSIKLSSIHPRLDAAGYLRSREEVLERLHALCARAARAGVPLTIDAEESERVPIQLDLLGQMAREHDFLGWNGLGLAVQAYRKDVLRVLQEVVGIAEARARRGGAPICVRLVKGAYWDAEVKRAQELGLTDYPVFTAKSSTDLAYAAGGKRLLEKAEILYPQFATHNPATLGIVLSLAETLGVAPERFECQRLHGMGQGVDGALLEAFPEVRLRVYAPVGRRPELLAYLVRRLLENGASSSFVRKAAASSDLDGLLEDAFAFLHADRASRIVPPRELHMPERKSAAGRDLGNLEELQEIAHAVASFTRRWSAAPLIDGKPVSGKAREARSPADRDAVIGEVVEPTVEQAQAALSSAEAAFPAWERTGVEERARCLERLADRLEADTVALMALCVWEAGKTLPDALADVREAVDFCRYYAAQARAAFAPRELVSPAGEKNILSLHGRGVFACISPWNFPVAIFTGQVAAALVSGNAVVAKPAEQTPLTAYRIANHICAAGVPAGVFHLLPGDGAIGAALVEDPRTAGVVFTGSIDTGRAIQRALAAREGPLVPLIAETGGLNAMLVDATALPEQVVDAVITSAFRSAGQRCSSLRMLYLEDAIAPPVLDMLKGAMERLRVGHPADPSSDIGPLIDAEAHRALAHYVSTLKKDRPVVAEAGPVPRKGHYLAPIAVEVRSIRDLPGERFGPILHVARFAIDDLDRVVDDINATGFGLTMGVHTRLDSRAERVRRRARVGNLYVNRNMIGALVGVQPFGGEGLSGTGPKAGGPLYLARFATERVCTLNTAAAGGDLGLLTQSV